MTSVTDKIARASWRLVPATLERKLRTEAGHRFIRFALVAAVAVITSQIVLGLLTGPIDIHSAGTAGVVASMVAALVSYLLSRWAWERKGKPDWLRETVPFWVVSIAVWIILGLTSHYASVYAHHMHYQHLMKHLVVQGAYFLMNCVTFVLRFLIFHYVLFAKKSSMATPSGEGDLLRRRDEVGAELATVEASRSDTGPMALVPGDSGQPPR